MTTPNRFWRYFMVPISLAGMLSISSAAELDPAAVIYKLPDQIQWGPVGPEGAQMAVLVGDPTKPGFYAVYNKWTKGDHFSGRISIPMIASSSCFKAPGGLAPVRNSIPPTPPRCRLAVL